MKNVCFHFYLWCVTHYHNELGFSFCCFLSFIHCVNCLPYFWLILIIFPEKFNRNHKCYSAGIPPTPGIPAPLLSQFHLRTHITDIHLSSCPSRIFCSATLGLFPTLLSLWLQRGMKKTGKKRLTGCGSGVCVVMWPSVAGSVFTRLF